MLKKLGHATVALCGFTALANAADLAPLPPESDWVFTVAPYGWLSGMSGDVQAGGSPTVDFDVSFSDILQHLEGVLMGAGEARNGRFSIGGDLIWTKLSDESNTPHGILVDKVEVTETMTILTGVVGYSLFYGDGGNLDAVAGARLWSADLDLDFKGGISPLSGQSFNGSQTWIDPIVGFKGRANISSDFYLTGWALVGGFGVSDDEFMWDVMGSVGYDFNNTFSMTAGYRGLGFDYRNNGLALDAVMSGPIIGAVFKF